MTGQLTVSTVNFFGFLLDLVVWSKHRVITTRAVLTEIPFSRFHLPAGGDPLVAPTAEMPTNNSAGIGYDHHVPFEYGVCK